MIFDLQKASVWKRLGAFLLDAILTVILATGVAYVMSLALGYNKQVQIYETACQKYEEQFGIKFDISEEEFNKYSAEQQQQWKDAYKALSEDKEAVRAYGLMVSFTLLITSFSILIPILVLEFIVPLCLKHGRTLGKRIFGLCLVQQNGVKVTTLAMFARSILGKYVLETMIPVLIFILIFFNTIGIVGVVIILLIGIVQIVLLIATKNNSLIHDIIAYTVVIDFDSQRIFENADELVAYQEKVAAEKAKNTPY